MLKDSNHQSEIFLSYAHRDEALVKAIYHRLVKLGYNCWFDEERIRLGENYHFAITRGIEQARVFLCFISRNYLESDYCEMEYHYAMERYDMTKGKIYIDDVRVGEFPDKSYIIQDFGAKNWLGFGKGEQDVDKIVEAIINSISFDVLKQNEEIVLGGDPRFEILSQFLTQYHRRITEDLVTAKISNNLFITVRCDEISYCGDKERTPLEDFVQHVSGEDKKHILFVGEGGKGKTTSLVKLGDTLLTDGNLPVYIPLCCLYPGQSVRDYLKNVVCGGRVDVWRHLEYFMQHAYHERPLVCLLLDGLNEMTEEGSRRLKQELQQYLAMSGVRIIVSSRPIENDTQLHFFKEEFHQVVLERLGLDVVNDYLEMHHVLRTNSKLKSLLQTPLLVTLYTNSQLYKQQLISDELEFDEAPTTIGKVFKNYFQTQINRSMKEGNYKALEYRVLLRYILPKLAVQLVQSKNYGLSLREIRAVIDGMEQDEIYLWLNDEEFLTFDSVDKNVLLKLATDVLHILKFDRSARVMTFVHQHFRDYFAADFLVSEVKASLYQNCLVYGKISFWGHQRFEKDIINFISDISEEELARPYETEMGDWVFPGKTHLGASSKSIVETYLELWRYREGELAQITVSNILEVMRYGRQNRLAWCDFSALDLRGSALNDGHYVKWYRDKYYPSCFDDAWLNRRNLLKDGHEVTITALTNDNDHFLFTGDKNGFIRVYDCEQSAWTDVIQPRETMVVDLEWNDKTCQLAILYEDCAYLYSIIDKEVLLVVENMSRYGRYRYIKFSQEQEILLASDYEPLVWRTLQGEKVRHLAAEVGPAYCATCHPSEKMYVRSYVNQCLIVTHYPFSEEDEKLIDLKEFGAWNIVNDLHFHPNGETLLVAVDHLLLEFETIDWSLRHSFKGKGRIRCASYRKEGVVLAMDSEVIFLGEDWEVLQKIDKASVSDIAVLTVGINQELYVFSVSGEIKLLDEQLRVKNIRRLQKRDEFGFRYKGMNEVCEGVTPVRNRLTQEVKLFILWKNFDAVLDYETGCYSHLWGEYELLEEMQKEVQYHIQENRLMFQQREETNRIQFINYTGLRIYGCSFKNMQGDICRHLKFIDQNGGIIA